MKIPSTITMNEKIYFGAFFFAFVTSGLPMLANAETYNANMNQFGKLLNDDKKYDVDSMPWRLRHKLIQDVCALSAGITATLLGLSGAGPILVTVTTFDLLGSLTSGITLARTKLKAEWAPTMVHGILGVWGLTLCFQHHKRR